MAPGRRADASPRAAGWPSGGRQDQREGKSLPASLSLGLKGRDPVAITLLGTQVGRPTLRRYREAPVGAQTV